MKEQVSQAGNNGTDARGNSDYPPTPTLQIIDSLLQDCDPTRLTIADQQCHLRLDGRQAFTELPEGGVQFALLRDDDFQHVLHGYKSNPVQPVTLLLVLP
ncbi:MAG: hypothetical protein ACLGXA_21140 [Acidobacteriota bacterium]